MTRVSELFGLLAQLAEGTAEEVDDDDGIDGVWECDVRAQDREFGDWLVAVNFDAESARRYQVREHVRAELQPGRGRFWPRGGDSMAVAVVGPGGGRVVGSPDDDLEGELIRDVRAELERVQSGETDAVGDGGGEAHE
jgi:hypothetical protein